MGPNASEWSFASDTQWAICATSGKVQLVCSEARKRPDGRRKYLACNDVKATARQIVFGYRLRWAVELFHKDVKMHLGFEDVATSGFDAVQSHVHWVYCAYILLHMSPPGVPPDVKSIGDKTASHPANALRTKKNVVCSRS